VGVFEKMYGVGKPLDESSIAAFTKGMHNGRTFMPPFPGNDKELEALAAYIKHLQQTGDVLEGAQNEGVVVNPKQSAEAVVELVDKIDRKIADSIAKNQLVNNLK
jgi:mono/diheme cytochrome c family protein